MVPLQRILLRYELASMPTISLSKSGGVSSTRTLCLPSGPVVLEFNTWLDPSETEQDEEPREVCPLCGRELRLIDSREKPSWYDVLNSPFRPSWYQQFTVAAEKLASPSQHTIESAKGSTVAKATKFNARSIPLHPFLSKSSPSSKILYCVFFAHRECSF